MPKKPLDLKDPKDLERLQSAAELVAYCIKHRNEMPNEQQWEDSLKRHIVTLEGRLHPEHYTFHGEPPRERIPA